MASSGKKRPVRPASRKNPPKERPDLLMQVRGYLLAHQEQAFLLKVIATFIVVYWLVEKTDPYLMRMFAVMAVILTPSFIVASSIFSGESLGDTLRKHITFIPTVHLEERRRDDSIA